MLNYPLISRAVITMLLSTDTRNMEILDLLGQEAIELKEAKESLDKGYYTYEEYLEEEEEFVSYYNSRIISVLNR